MRSPRHRNSTELDAFLEHMIAPMPGDADYDGSYFAGGRVSAEAIEKLFTACRFLFEVEPWTVVDDKQVLRMDIPALDVDGACLSVIGQRDAESPGVLVFPSVHGFKQFLKATASGAIEDGTDALGSELLAVTFESSTELPPAMRREAMEHGWPVATADAYPLAERRAPDGMPLPLIERDFQIATACALSFTAFFARHAAIFESDTFDAVCESYFNDDDLEVRFAAPYDRFADFGLRESAHREPHSSAPARIFRPRAGRNEPCPCGSGRKYKKCHLPQDAAEQASLQATTQHGQSR